VAKRIMDKGYDMTVVVEINGYCILTAVTIIIEMQFL